MRRGLILGLATVVFAGCAQYTPAPGVGADGFQTTVPTPSGTVAVEGVSPTTAPLELGGVPLPRNGAPILTVRGTTWPPSRPSSATPVVLNAGSYLVWTSVSPELDSKTKQRYRCTVTFSLRPAKGVPVFTSAALPAGTTTAIFNSAGPGTVTAVATGAVGCTWSMLVFKHAAATGS